jgi:hypothetical protein
VFMVGAFVGYYAVTPFTIRVAKIGLSLPVNLHIGTDSIAGGTLALLLAMAFCALLGIIIERLAYRPLRQCSKLTVLITAIGVSLFFGEHGPDGLRRGPEAVPGTFSRARVFPGRDQCFQQPTAGDGRVGLVGDRIAVHREENENGDGDARGVAQSGGGVAGGNQQ